MGGSDSGGLPKFPPGLGWFGFGGLVAVVLCLFQFFFEGAVVGEDLVDVGFAAVEVDEAIAVGDGGEAVFFVPGAVEESFGVVGAIFGHLDEAD